MARSITAALIGNSSGGKSASGNTFFGYHPCSRDDAPFRSPEGAQMGNVTQEVHGYEDEVVIGDVARNLRVIDSPSLQHSELENHEVFARWNWAEHAPNGIDIFIFCMAARDLSEIESMRACEAYLGPGLSSRAVLLLTGQTNDWVQEQFRNPTSMMEEMSRRVGGRVLGIDNKDADEGRKWQDQQRLLATFVSVADRHPESYDLTHLGETCAWCTGAFARAERLRSPQNKILGRKAVAQVADGLHSREDADASLRNLEQQEETSSRAQEQANAAQQKAKDDVDKVKKEAKENDGTAACVVFAVTAAVCFGLTIPSAGLTLPIGVASSVAAHQARVDNLGFGEAGQVFTQSMGSLGSPPDANEFRDSLSEL